jgi:acetyl esterase
LTELDPQVRDLLQQFRANTAQHAAPATQLSVHERIVAKRERLKSLASQVGLPSEPVSETRDFVIRSRATDVPARLYVPASTQVPLRSVTPALLYYHGGGFVAGDLETHDSLLRALANRAQCRVVSVAYRLAPENPYPAANEDAWGALTGIVEHAAEFGIDRAQLAVGGDSAGGLLAAWVAQKAARGGPRLRLQVLLYPNLDATTSRLSWKQLVSGAYLVSLAEMTQDFDAFNREDPQVSPLFAADLTSVGPALIVTADHDPLRDEGDEYAAKLKSANVAVEHTRWEGMVHGFASLAGVLDAGRLLVDQIGAALRKAFE